MVKFECPNVKCAGTITLREPENTGFCSDCALLLGLSPTHDMLLYPGSSEKIKDLNSGELLEEVERRLALIETIIDNAHPNKSSGEKDKMKQQAFVEWLKKEEIEPTLLTNTEEKEK